MLHGTDELEDRLRRSAAGLPTAPDGAGRLGDVIARGRRGRTLALAGRLGVAGILLAGTAVAAPSLLERDTSTPTVVTGIDETVEKPGAAEVAVEIHVTSPRDGTVVTTTEVSFFGRATVGSRVAVDGHGIELAPDGRWRITLDLDEGENQLEFEAVDRAGNRAAQTITVVVATPTAAPVVKDEPKPEADEKEPVKAQPVAAKPAPAPAAKPAPKSEPAKTPAKPAVAFTSHQKYGSCSEPVPYDEFWGTAKPGSEVWVWSEYGQKTVAVNGDGNWAARVEFPSAPQGKAFQVKTKSLATGEKLWFEFVNNGEGGTHAGPVEWSAWQHEQHVEWDPPYNYYEGTATSGTVIEVASPHGSARTTADSQGHWKTKVWFETAPYGTNTWTVVVESSAGDRSTFEFTGTRPEPKAEPKPEPKPEPEPQAEAVAFTSDQVHDTTDDTPPSSLYAGTAPAGHKVWVSSEYGEGHVYADESGRWSLWVEFPSAPRGSSFPVKVKHWDTGEVHTYTLQVV